MTNTLTDIAIPVAILLPWLKEALADGAKATFAARLHFASL